MRRGGPAHAFFENGGGRSFARKGCIVVCRMLLGGESLARWTQFLTAGSTAADLIAKNNPRSGSFVRPNMPDTRTIL